MTNPLALQNKLILSLLIKRELLKGYACQLRKFVQVYNKVYFRIYQTDQLIVIYHYQI